MRTYVSPIGYDTRRVTRPVLNTGLGASDTVRLLRPEHESDTERATQAIADVEQFLREIEPGVGIDVTRITTASIDQTIRECCELIEIRGEYPRLPVSDECSDQSEPRSEQAGDEADMMGSNRPTIAGQSFPR